MIERYIVTAVDTAESADGKARVLAAFKYEDDAKAYVKRDMENFVSDSEGMDVEADFDAMSIHTGDYNYGCEWNIEKISTEL